MKYGLDLDGVLCDFGGQVIRAGNEMWPGKFPPGFLPKNWDYEGYLTPHEWKQLWAKIDETPYFWENVGEDSGCEELQEHIKKTDEVFFITARRPTIGESPAIQSAHWLAARGLWPRDGYSTVIAVDSANFKKDIFRALKINFMLDDYAPTVEELNEIGTTTAFLLDRPWNDAAQNLPRVYSVREYLNAIRGL